MKCPVCDQENSAMLCPGCGFDSSMDYGRYPTFAPVGKVPSVSARRAERDKSHESAKNQKLTLRIKALEKELEDTERESSKKIRELCNRIEFLEATLHNYQSQSIKQENSILKQNIHHLRQRNDRLGRKNRDLNEINAKLKMKNTELEAALNTERSKSLLSRIFNR